MMAALFFYPDERRTTIYAKQIAALHKACRPHRNQDHRQFSAVDKFSDHCRPII